MTSRRSRLKAVTNLPVRRKAVSLQGDGNEASSEDNPSSEKIYSYGSNPDGTTAQTYSTLQINAPEKNIDDSSNKNNENEPALAVNGASDLQNNSDLLNDKIISKTDEHNNLETIGNTNITNACNLLIYKTDGNSSSMFNTNVCFKSNLVLSSISDTTEEKNFQKNKEKEISQEQVYGEANNYNINNNNNNYNNNNNNNSNININNSYNNDNNSINNNYNNPNDNVNKISSNIIQNNIVEDGFKCYTVLTPQSVTLNSLTDYTITSLTPCVNTYVDTSVSDVSTLQEYREVQIYSEVEPPELYVNNGVDENCESEIETECVEPILNSLTSCTSEQDLNNLNVGSLNSNVGELKNASKSLISKTAIKNKSLNSKTHLNGKDEFSINVVSQAKNSQVLERTGTLNSQNVPSDINSFKQSISTFRRKKSKFNDFTKKLADAKREFQKKYEKTKPDRSTLKMIDLIFYNPATNPMESKNKCEKKDNSAPPTSDVVNELLAEEKVDEPEVLDCSSRSNLSDNGETENINQMPVPQVKIGLDGEIILDEKSLVIETSDVKKGREGLQNSVPVFDDECKVSYYRGKSKKTRDWADFETKRFYKALNTIGPDFSLMQKYFPKRSRLELKNKFKREERMNRSLIDKALNNPSEFDMTQLEKDLAIEKEAEEEEIEMRLCKIVKQAAKRPKIRSSLLSREIIEPDGEISNNLSKSCDGNSKRLSENEKNKKEKEFDFVFQKLLMKESEKLNSKLPSISTDLNIFKNPDNGVT